MINPAEFDKYSDDLARIGVDWYDVRAMSKYETILLMEVIRLRQYIDHLHKSVGILFETEINKSRTEVIEALMKTRLFPEEWIKELVSLRPDHLR